MKKILLRQTSSHSALLVARRGDVSRKLSQAFLLVFSFNFNFVVDERSNIHSHWHMIYFFDGKVNLTKHNYENGCIV